MTEFDLNLLRVFDALYEERMVSRAAARLHVTPSAVSHALRRLRASLGDPLFVREPGGLHPTARADELKPAFEEALNRLRQALSAAPFEPATDTRVFRVAAGAMVVEAFGPFLVREAARRAPGVRVQFWTVGPDLTDWLDEEMIDLAIGSFEEYPKRFVAARLFAEELVWIAREGHPLAHELADLKAVLGLSRVGIAAGDGPLERSGTRSDRGLKRRARQVEPQLPPGDEPERIAMPAATVFDSRSVLAIVEQTDLVGLVPRRLSGPARSRFAVRTLDRFPPSPTASIDMLWHRSRSTDSGHQWLRAILQRASAMLSAAAES